MLEALYVIQSHHRAVVFRQLHHGRVQPFLQLMDVHLPGDASVGGGDADELWIVFDARIYIVKTDLVMPAALLDEDLDLFAASLGGVFSTGMMRGDLLGDLISPLHS